MSEAMPICSAVDKWSPNATYYSFGRSNIAPIIARWATQLSMSGEMIYNRKHAGFVLIIEKKIF